MPESAADFATLLERARRGDRAAVEELAGRYEGRVRVVARVLLGPALRPYLDTLDLVQSVHKSLLVGLRDDRFDLSTPENLVALAVTLVRRKAARHWRRLQRQRRLDGGLGAGGDLATLLTSLSSPGPDPAQAAGFADAVRHLCAGLDEAERRMLQLRLQDYSTAEIAAELGLSAVALRVRLTRLRQRLRSARVLDDWV
jgi:RNA polymerase sigma-70 factor (ECF subfamily)